MKQTDRNNTKYYIGENDLNIPHNYHDYAVVVFILFYLPIKSLILGMKWLKHKYFKMCGFKLNKYD